MGGLGSIPGLGRSFGEGNGSPLQYSCLEDPTDGGAGQATVHGVAKNQTQLSDFTFTFFQDLAIPIVGIYPEQTKTEKDTLIPLFIAPLFTMAKTWKQPRCPLTDEWIKKLWYIYTMEYYSAIKRNACELVLMRRMNLEPIIQSEVSQREKDKYCILMYIFGI